MNKYLCCIILGIIIFLLLNRYNGFSVGIADINQRCSHEYDDEQICNLPNPDGQPSVQGITCNYPFGQYTCVCSDGNDGNEIDRCVSNDTEESSAKCSVKVTQQTYMEVALVISNIILEDELKSSDLARSLDYAQNRTPFQTAIAYTLMNDQTPLFYSASRFYFTIIHLLRNGSINNLTINEPDRVATIESGTNFFGALRDGNSSTRTGIFSVSTCLCDFQTGESATYYYFNRFHMITNEPTDDDAVIIRRLIEEHIPSSTDPTEKSRIMGILDTITGLELISRVLIILKPKTSEIDALLESNIRITLAYGFTPSRTDQKSIITLNQDMETIKYYRSKQARLLYRNSEWEAIVFLSDVQKEIINRFGIIHLE